MSQVVVSGVNSAGKTVAIKVSDDGSLGTSTADGATAAKQDTIIGHLDGVEGSLTTINTSIGNQSLVDNAAFTDGTTRVLTAGYIFDEVAGTALTENDAAAARIDSKRAIINVIEDATTRGRRATVNSGGYLMVQPASDVPDNTGFVDGTTPVSVLGGIYDEVAGTALTENDAAAARIDSKRAIVMAIEDATTRGRRVTVNANNQLEVNAATTGTPYNYIMQPAVQASASTANDKEFISDSTGFTALEIEIAGITSSSAEAVVIGWSSTVNDESTVKTAIDSITTGTTGLYDAPLGTAVLNTRVLSLARIGNSCVIEVDRSTPIKTFGVELTGTAAGTLVLVTAYRAA
jgi:hypothetical protein